MLLVYNPIRSRYERVIEGLSRSPSPPEHRWPSNGKVTRCLTCEAIRWKTGDKINGKRLVLFQPRRCNEWSTKMPSCLKT